MTLKAHIKGYLILQQEMTQNSERKHAARIKAPFPISTTFSATNQSYISRNEYINKKQKENRKHLEKFEGIGSHSSLTGQAQTDLLPLGDSASGASIHRGDLRVRRRSVAATSTRVDGNVKRHSRKEAMLGHQHHHPLLRGPKRRRRDCWEDLELKGIGHW
ncbi:ATP phosphoribosyltransferase 2, chloroplastic [Senna tora]|uniref:ATP phosphoribosyltransferase 2, chloroplastic n=1 Tax=Senna tora TaxID=362788 RepID=A0A834SJA9_9FABA|nr:ATP phosphoribosyltransferase 2, chloroplastic [Senna tora]